MINIRCKGVATMKADALRPADSAMRRPGVRRTLLLLHRLRGSALGRHGDTCRHGAHILNTLISVQQRKGVGGRNAHGCCPLPESRGSNLHISARICVNLTPMCIGDITLKEGAQGVVWGCWVWMDWPGQPCGGKNEHFGGFDKLIHKLQVQLSIGNAFEMAFTMRRSQ